MDVTLTPEGKITLIEKEIDRKDLPKAVAETFNKKYPKATYKIVEEVIKVVDGKETLEYYEALLVTADKKTFEVEVLPDGEVQERDGEEAVRCPAKLSDSCTRPIGRVFTPQPNRGINHANHNDHDGEQRVCRFPDDLVGQYGRGSDGRSELQLFSTVVDATGIADDKAVRRQA